MAKYFEICKLNDQNLIGILSKNFEDQNWYNNTTNAVILTWYILFEQITRNAPFAIFYFKIIIYYAKKIFRYYCFLILIKNLVCKNIKL